MPVVSLAGNIRELQHIVERSVILSSGDTFWIEKAWLANQEAARQELPGPLPDTLKNQREKLLKRLLRKAKGKSPAQKVRQRNSEFLDRRWTRKLSSWGSRNAGLSLSSSKSFFLIPENPALAEVSSSYDSV